MSFEDAVFEQAMRLGMEPGVDDEYLWLAEESLRAPVPSGWEMANDESRRLPYFYNESTGATQWDHPMDETYRERFQALKNEKRRRRSPSTLRQPPSNGRRKEDDHQRRRPNSDKVAFAMDEPDADVAGKQRISSSPDISRRDDRRIEAEMAKLEQQTAAATVVAEPSSSSASSAVYQQQQLRRAAQKELEELRRSSKADIERMKGQLDAAKKEAADELARIEKAKSQQVDKVTAELEALRLSSEREVRELREEVSRARERGTTLERDARELRDEASQASADSKSLKQRLVESLAARDAAGAAATAAVEEARQIRFEVEASRRERDRVRRLLQDEITSLKGRVDVVTRELGDKNGEIRRLKAELSQASEAAEAAVALSSSSSSNAGGSAAIRHALDTAQQKIAELTRQRLASERTIADLGFEHARRIQEVEASKRAIELAQTDAENRAANAEASRKDADRRLAEKDSDLARALRDVADAQRHAETSASPLRLEKSRIERDLAEAKSALELADAERKGFVAKTQAEMKRMALEVADAAESEWKQRLKDAVEGASRKNAELSDKLKEAEAKNAALSDKVAEFERSRHHLADENDTYKESAKVAMANLETTDLELQRTRHLLAKEYEDAELRRAIQQHQQVPASPYGLPIDHLQRRLAAIQDDVRKAVNGTGSDAAPFVVVNDYKQQQTPPLFYTTTARAEQQASEESIGAAVAAAKAAISRSSPNGKRYDPPFTTTPLRLGQSATDISRRTQSGPGYRRNLWRQIYGVDDIDPVVRTPGLGASRVLFDGGGGSPVNSQTPSVKISPTVPVS